MKQMLAIDIGNTNITVGLFKGARLARKAKINTHGYSSHEKRLRSFLKKEVVRDVVISSVVPAALGRFIKSLKNRRRAPLRVPYRITIIGKDMRVPISNLYRVKSEVGQDRLVNAFAAKTLYGAPAVIIDFGTAITFDIVSRRGEYLGGLILPGIEMGLSSLYSKTALLPEVKLKPAKYIIGKDTVNSMRGGILFGYGAMCDGLIERYRKILGRNLKVIATGGNAKLIKRYAKSIRIIDEDLTLKGLLLTWTTA